MTIKEVFSLLVEVWMEWKYASLGNLKKKGQHLKCKYQSCETYFQNKSRKKENGGIKGEKIIFAILTFSSHVHWLLISRAQARTRFNGLVMFCFNVLEAVNLITYFTQRFMCQTVLYYNSFSLYSVFVY